jgi:hypothetical protein
MSAVNVSAAQVVAPACLIGNKKAGNSGDAFFSSCATAGNDIRRAGWRHGDLIFGDVYELRADLAVQSRQVPGSSRWKCFRPSIFVDGVNGTFPSADN